MKFRANNKNDLPIEEIKNALDIVNVAQSLHPSLKRRGAIYQGGHDGVHSSTMGQCLTIWPDTQSWHCFHCDHNGDVITLIGFSLMGENYTNSGSDFHKALEEAARIAGIKLRPVSAEQQKQMDEEARIYGILTDSARWFNSQLKNYPDITEWLKTNYGFTNEFILAKSIGFAPKDSKALTKYLLSRGYSEDELLAASIINKGGMCRYTGRIMFPYWQRGRVTYFAARFTDYCETNEFECFINKESGEIVPKKYRKLKKRDEQNQQIAPFINNPLLGTDNSKLARQKGYWLITEGLPDQLAAEQAGEPAISPVTVQFKDEDVNQLIELIKDSSVTKCYIFNDTEDNRAGEKGALKTARLLEQAGIKCYIGQLPISSDASKVDVCEFIRDNGAIEFTNLYYSALRLPDYSLLSLAIPKDNDGKSRLIKEVALLATEVCQYDAVSLENLQKDLRQKTGVSASTIKSFFKKPELEKETPDQEDYAAKFAELAGENLRYDEGMDIWRFWTGTYWKEVLKNSTRVYDLAVQAITECEGQRYETNVKGTISLSARKLVKEFKPNPGLINFKSGTYVIASGDIKPHDKNDGLLYCLDYNLDLYGDCHRITAHLENVIPDECGRKAYMEHVGLALLGDLEVQKAVLLYGPTRSGKGTLLSLACVTLGLGSTEFASKDVFSRELEGKRERYKWANRQFCPIDEFPEEARSGGTEEFKQCTAHSGVDTRAIGAHPISQTWRPKIIMATNNKPKFNDASGAAANRLIMISCPNSWLGQEDFGLFKRLQEEIGAFARKCLEAAQEMLARKKYSESFEMKQAVESLIIDSDPVKTFVLECAALTIMDDNKMHRVFSGKLYEQFQIWCKANGHFPGSNRSMSDKLLGYAPWRIKKGRHTRLGTPLIGIALVGEFKQALNTFGAPIPNKWEWELYSEEILIKEEQEAKDAWVRDALEDPSSNEMGF